MAKKRVLFLASDPSDAARLRLGEEHREIADALRRSRHRGLRLDQVFALRPTDLSQALHDFRPQIVHFSGHGTSTGEICLEDASGVSRPVSQSAIASLFGIAKGDIECVVLNACHSEAQATEISKYVKYVIAMTDTISDPAAITFASGLYKALASGRNYPDAFEYGLAELRICGIGESDTPTLILRPTPMRRSHQGEREFVELELLPGVLMEVEPLDARAPLRGLVRDPYRGWYESPASNGISPGYQGLPDHISVCLDPPPADVPRDERRRRETMAVLVPNGFTSIREFLDDLYLHFVSDRFRPASYGLDWVLWGTNTRQSRTPRQGIHPDRVILPWSWLADRSTSILTSKWAESSLNSLGLGPGTLLHLGHLVDETSILDPNHPSLRGSSGSYRRDRIAYDDIFGLEVNDEDLLDHVLAGPGKQPLGALRSGRLVRRELDAPSAGDFVFRELLIDKWMGRPAGGSVLMQHDATRTSH